MTGVRNPKCRYRLVAGLATAAVLTGCGQNGKPVSSASTVPATPPATSVATVQAVPGRSPQKRYEAAIAALQQGQAAQARTELAALLQQRPGDSRASLLLREIDTDPKQLYGGDSFSYTVKAGDTLFSLARKYLKNPLNFYGLARYNGLNLPAELQPGSSILIPGHPRAPEIARPVAVRKAPAAQAGPAAAASAPSAAPAFNAGARQRAQHLRQQGLEQMSAGSIDRAVGLLSQASSLDPEDGAIAGDLARARRIQATVRSK